MGGNRGLRRTDAARHSGSIIHPEGRILISLTAIVAAFVVAVRFQQAANDAPFRGGARLVPRLGIAGWSLVGCAALIAQFFRHPGCTTPLDDELVVSPAYGRVVHIGVEPETEVLQDRRMRVSVFLSLFDPHLTRSPVGGRVIYQRYHPGQYLVALHPKASSLNERSSIAIEHSSGAVILVRQIAGFLARRICTYPVNGSIVSAGQEIGFIKLGSRVDIFLPESAEILVRSREYVHAGSSPIARLSLAGA